MKAEEVRIATLLLIGALISIVNTNCGSSTSPPPPPPALTVSMSPATATVQEGLTQTFTATVNNDPANKGVTWTLSCAIATGCGSLSATSTPSGTAVTYTALGNTPLSNAATVTLTATSAADTAKSASAEVTIPVPPTLSPIPTMGLTHVNGNILVAVQRTPSDPSTWSLTGCSGGAGVCGSLVLPTSGCPVNNGDIYCFNQYAAPVAPPPGGQVTVVATSGIDPTISATATVVVSPINFASTNYSAGNAPQGVAAADFNGDGLLDIVVADYGNPSASDNGGVNILLGRGDGTFQAANLMSAGMNPTSIAAGDFNGDGKADLLVSDAGTLPSGGSGNLAVLLGNGDGTFQSPITISAGIYPYALALGDFNQDGKLDIAVTDFGNFSGNGGAVYVLLRNGNGTFQTPVLYNGGAPTGTPISIVARDFNGDGKLDLAVASGGGFPTPTSTVGILLGNGDGTFQTVTLNPVFMYPTSLAAGDFNGDGKTDLALSAYICPTEYCASSIQVLLGNADGSFQGSQDASLTYSFGANNLPGELSLCKAFGFNNWRGMGLCLPSALQVADFNGSGKAGLVGIGDVPVLSGNGVFVMPGNGDGTFEGILSYPGPTPDIRLGLAVGDFNGDGKPDIVVANYDINGVTVLLNQTTPSGIQAARKGK